jgi:hypothetical protein
MLWAVTVLAGLILVLRGYVVADTLLGLHRMKQLGEVEPSLGADPPKVSLIVPACNEAETIGPALQTLLGQDYPNLEIIVVDDRSTDHTGRVVSELAAAGQYDLHLLRVDHLPPDWIGKPHALSRGAQRASGEILLFTDADIRMEKTAVSRAVSLMTQEHLDHLSVIFQTLGGNWLLNALILDAASGLLTMFKPWQAGNAKSRFFMGVGAFNMVRSDCYTGCGGHQAIPMHPIDDLMLGKLVKTGGYRQDCVLGKGMITVYWYASVSAMVSGLMKNSFSVFHYRLWLAAAAMVLIGITDLLPLAGMLAHLGAASYLFAASVGLRLAGFAYGAALSSMPPVTVAGALVSPFINLYIIARAALVTIREQGITWRGTFYPLEKLRKSAPLFF